MAVDLAEVDAEDLVADSPEDLEANVSVLIVVIESNTNWGFHVIQKNAQNVMHR